MKIENVIRGVNKPELSKHHACSSLEVDSLSAHQLSACANDKTFSTICLPSLLVFSESFGKQSHEQISLPRARRAVLISAHQPAASSGLRFGKKD